MKVLITGGAGFIGSNHAHFHCEKYPEDEVVVLDKLTYAGNLKNLEDLMKNEGFKFVEGDIANGDYVDGLFAKEKFDTVINFAAETHVDRSILNPKIFTNANVLGTQNLLEAARKYGIKRFHQISTDEVYGDLPLDSDEKFNEERPLRPNSPYAASKAAADLLVRSYFSTYRLPVTISRCSNNYGPYQFPEKLIPYFFTLLSEGKKVPVYGDGRHVRDWLYVGDHCRAVDLILNKGALGGIYEIGDGNEMSNLEITKLMLEFFDKDESFITYVNDRSGHDRRYAVDSAKIRALGWEPETKFSEGIEKTFNWYKSNSDWLNDLKSRVEERKHEKVSDKPLQPARD